MTELSPEARLVFACSRRALTEPEKARVDQLARSSLDWDCVLRLALRHGVAPLLHRHLCGSSVVPKAAQAALWARAESSAKRARAMAAELVAISVALGREGVGFAPFKGPLLAAHAYGDIALRECGDLDLLVAPRDVRRARAVLEARGYRLATPMDPVREELWLASPERHELGLVDDARGFMVELQWSANPGVNVPALGEARWWESAPRTTFEGVELRTLPEHENVLALLVHGSKHLWSAAGWLVDIAELARAGTIPWDATIDLARAHGAVRRAALGLGLARRLLDAPLPPAVVAFVDGAEVAPLVEAIAQSSAAPEYEAPSIAGRLRAELAMLDTASQRIARVLLLAHPTPGDWQAVRLPRALTGLYWGVRPARLAAKYLASPRSPRSPAGATPRTPPPRPRSTG